MDFCPGCGEGITQEVCTDRECYLKSRQKELQAIVLDKTSKALTEEESKEVLELVSELQEIASELLELVVGEEDEMEEDKSIAVDTLKSIAVSKSLPHKIKSDGTASCSFAFSIDAKAYKPKDSDLEKINKISLVPLDPEKVYIFEFQAADEQVDRAYEHFSTKALKSMADLAVKNKIPFITEGEYDHQHRQKNIFGVVFDAYVKSGKLIYKTYIPDIPRNKDVLDAVLTGLYNKLSVGFSMNPYKDFVCDSCNKSVYSESCSHFPGAIDEKGRVTTATIKDVIDNYEISGVAVPCQREARILEEKSQVKDMSLNSLETKENSIVDTILIGTPTEISSKMDEKEIKSEEETTEVTQEVTSEKTSEDAQTEVKSQPVEEIIASLVADSVEKAVAKALEANTEAKEVSVKVEPVKVELGETDAVLKTLLEKIEALETKLAEALKVSEGAVDKQLSKSETVEQATASKSWLMERFGIDLGGQID